MDALKFAFEILIVGALALPWLAMLIRAFSPVSAGGDSEHQFDSLRLSLSVIPADARPTVSLALLVATGYLLGSAVSRVSRSVFNDELLMNFPTEDKIRAEVYYNEYCTERLLGDLSFPEIVLHTSSNIPEALCARDDGVAKPKDNERLLRLRKWGMARLIPDPFSRRVEEIFSLQEGKLLLSGEDKVARLKQYYDQITVLRGASLNGAILFFLSVFGVLGGLRARWRWTRLLNAATFVPGLLITLYAAYSLWFHSREKLDVLFSEPPLAELVFLLLGVIGLFIVARARYAPYYLPTAAVAAVLAIISFGGWWWTEVMYDLQVIHSVPRLELGPDTQPGPGR